MNDKEVNMNTMPFEGEIDLLKGLNDEQHKAVCHDEGPLLILAGAGSGKTRVITYRIAYLIRHRGVQPPHILAITFTNKAANEMKERIYDLIGSASSYMWVGTFHSMFARILRRHAELIGHTQRFSIIDTDDQLKIIKESTKALDLNDKVFVPRMVLGEISRAKNDLVSVDEYAKMAGNDYRRSKIASIYKSYMETLKRTDSMDFDDILYHAVRLLADHPDVLTYYQEQFRYILVDEYQDTNHAQYKLILLLAKKYRNLCVVGDDDQSIYAFRGANIRNILDFENDFKDTEVIKLETNYRSTQTILNAANSVIANNQKRKKKALRTHIKDGDKLVHYCAEHHGAEAYYVVNEIKRLTRSGKMKYSDMAVLYRMNALSRTVETALREQEIPYRVFGGQRFYERKEIKDVMAYLRLIASPADEYAFIRIINTPKRGIGDTTVERIRSIAREDNITCLDVCRQVEFYPELARAAGKLTSFYAMIDNFRTKLDENDITFSAYIEHVQDQSGLIDEIVETREKKGDTVDRVENLRELLSEAVEFENRRRNAPQSQISDNNQLNQGDGYDVQDPIYSLDLSGILQAYLENAALYSEGDDEQQTDDYVRLMSIHSAKGLEFGAVFLIGAEEGIFPSARSMDTRDDIEEERRLMYVAITRAKQRFAVITSYSRILFGQTQALKPSRFLKEIASECIECLGDKRRVFDTAQSRDAEFARAIDNKSNGALAFGNYKAAPSTVSNHDGSYLGPANVEKGMKVSHARFGVGTIKSVEKVAGDALVCIVFDNQTSKNMLLRHAKLKRV